MLPRVTAGRVDMNTRLRAVIIDGIMTLVPFMLTFMVGLFLTDTGDPTRAWEISRTLLGLFPLWTLAYFATEAVTGRTLGKVAAGIAVRAADGGRASPGALLLRWAAKFVWLFAAPAVRMLWWPAPPGRDPLISLMWLIALGGFFLAARADRQTLWDKVAGTAVYPR